MRWSKRSFSWLVQISTDLGVSFRCIVVFQFLQQKFWQGPHYTFTRTPYVLLTAASQPNVIMDRIDSRNRFGKCHCWKLQHQLLALCERYYAACNFWTGPSRCAWSFAAVWNQAGMKFTTAKNKILLFLRNLRQCSLHVIGNTLQ